MGDGRRETQAGGDGWREPHPHAVGACGSIRRKTGGSKGSWRGGRQQQAAHQPRAAHGPLPLAVWGRGLPVPAWKEDSVCRTEGPHVPLRDGGLFRVALLPLPSLFKK